MQVMLTLDGRTAAGGTPLVTHNERLADPLDEYARAIKQVSGKRSKTDADHLEIARLEFLGGLYTNGNGPCLPAVNIIRCLQEGAKRIKRGPDVLRGVSPLAQHADIAYDGSRDPEVMWKEGKFSLRKSVGVQRARVMRTRPIFIEWRAVLPVEVDPTVWDPDALETVWQQAGRYAGMGEMRPIYGKFLATIVTGWKLRNDVSADQAAYALACAVTSQQIQTDDEGRAARYNDPSALCRGAERLLDRLRGKTPDA